MAKPIAAKTLFSILTNSLFARPPASNGTLGIHCHQVNVREMNLIGVKKPFIPMH